MRNLSAAGRTGRRVAGLAAAGAVAAALTVAGGAAAQASTLSGLTLTDQAGHVTGDRLGRLQGLTLRPQLTLSDQAGHWTAAGSRFAPARSDVAVWVMDAANWTTVEHRSGVHTTSPNQQGSGGAFTVSGAQHYVPASGIFGGGTVNDHPLQCGHSYQAVGYDPADGYVYSDVLAEPACPVIR